MPAAQAIGRADRGGRATPPSRHSPHPALRPATPPTAGCGGGDPSRGDATALARSPRCVRGAPLRATRWQRPAVAV